MRTFFVQNFGCRATQADGAALEALLAGRGLAAAGERALADLVVLNTCTVTSEADSDARQTVRRVHRENGAARILVTGCYAQRAPEELAALPGVEWVVGNSHKTQIADLAVSITTDRSATDFGQLILLFAKRRLADYSLKSLKSPGQDRIGADAATKLNSSRRAAKSR